MTIARRHIAVAAAAVTLAFGSLVATGGLSANAGQKGVEGAGGKGVAHYAGGKKLHRSDVPTSRLFRVGLTAGEPTIGVTHDNNVYYVAIQANTRVEVLKSADQGGTWDIVSPKLPSGRNAQLLSFDPYIWVDDAEGVDRIFTIDLTVACSYVSFSDDEGKTWTTNPLACGRPVNDHQTLFSGRPAISPPINYPNIVYYCWNDIGTSSCSKSLDGGLTFHPTGSPAFVGPNAGEQASCGGLHGHGHVDQQGNVYLPRGYCGQPYVAISRDEGLTWEQHQVAKSGTVDHEMSVATDVKGNIYVTWLGKDRLIYLAISKDDGESWSKPMMVAAPGVNETDLPSLDVGGVGKVALAYMGTTNSPGMPFPDVTGTSTNPDCMVAQLPCPPPEEYKNTTWNGYLTVTKNALDRNPVFFSATVNDPKDPFKRGTCGPGRCGLDILDFIDVTIAPDGQVWSSWVDACNFACSEPNGEQDMGADGVVGTLLGINLR
jgi:hypothetical protein